VKVRERKIKNIIPSPTTEDYFAHFGVHAILWGFQSFYGSPPKANVMPKRDKQSSVIGEEIISTL